MKNYVVGLMLFSFILVLISSAIADTDTKPDDSGKVLKNDALRLEPFRDAKVIAALEKGDEVQIIKRDGGWYKVKSTRGNGWVRMLSIRRAVAKNKGITAKGILGLATGRVGKGQIVLTTGIRGLDEKNLKTAKFNQQQLSLLESYGVSKVQALIFAREGKLSAKSVAYLNSEGSK